MEGFSGLNTAQFSGGSGNCVAIGTGITTHKQGNKSTHSLPYGGLIFIDGNRYEFAPTNEQVVFENGVQTSGPSPIGAPANLQVIEDSPKGKKSKKDKKKKRKNEEVINVDSEPAKANIRYEEIDLPPMEDEKVFGYDEEPVHPCVMCESREAVCVSLFCMHVNTCIKCTHELVEDNREKKKPNLCPSCREDTVMIKKIIYP